MATHTFRFTFRYSYINHILKLCDIPVHNIRHHKLYLNLFTSISWVHIWPLPGWHRCANAGSICVTRVSIRNRISTTSDLCMGKVEFGCSNKCKGKHFKCLLLHIEALYIESMILFTCRFEINRRVYSFAITTFPAMIPFSFTRARDH